MYNNLKKNIVPWRNPAEFLKVYRFAYSNDVAKLCWAVEQIAIWETRCWPSLPTAVEVTSLFLRSKIQEMLTESGTQICCTTGIEMMYSDAIIRFVNLIVEQGQNSKRKKRMSYIAADKNIPPWIVEIRHNCTHGFHPTLPVLKMASVTILAYLDDNFWAPESSRINYMKKTIDEKPMTELVQEYRLALYEDASTLNRDKKNKKIEKVLKKINFFLSKPESRRIFLNVFVRDFVTEGDVEAMAADDSIFMDPNAMDACTLPFSFQKFYEPIIHLLHKHDLIPTFLELLLLSQEKRDKKICQKVVDAAVVHFFNLVNAAKGIDEDSAKPFVCKGVNLDRYKLLYSCVRGCSNTGRLVFEKLIKDMKIGEWGEELATMMNIKRGTSLPRTLGGYGGERQKRKFDLTYSPADLEEDFEDDLEKFNFKSKSNRWFSAPLEIDWASIPIGHVFNPVEAKVKIEFIEEEENTVEVNDNVTVSKESDPVEIPVPTTNFIFDACPSRPSLIYRRNYDEMEY